MSDPFIGEIRIVGFSFAPTGWAFCDGQLLPISQNTALFSILGTTYGGDGRSTFGLPNLQGVAPLHAGKGPGLSSRDLGESGGEVAVTLTESQMPNHNHPVNSNSGTGDQVDPAGNIWAGAGAARSESLYAAAPGSLVPMNPQAFAPSGGSQPHNNMPPYLALNFIIALTGIFPSR